MEVEVFPPNPVLPLFLGIDEHLESFGKRIDEDSDFGVDDLVFVVRGVFEESPQLDFSLLHFVQVGSVFLLFNDVQLYLPDEGGGEQVHSPNEDWGQGVGDLVEVVVEEADLLIDSIVDFGDRLPVKILPSLLCPQDDADELFQEQVDLVVSLELFENEVSEVRALEPGSQFTFVVLQIIFEFWLRLFELDEDILTDDEVLVERSPIDFDFVFQSIPEQILEPVESAGPLFLIGDGVVALCFFDVGSELFDEISLSPGQSIAEELIFGFLVNSDDVAGASNLQVYSLQILV